nr:HAN_1g46 [Cryptomonas curvata]
MLLTKIYLASLQFFKISKSYSKLKVKKSFISSDYNSTKNEKKISFYPEFLGVTNKNKTITLISKLNFNFFSKIIFLNTLKSCIIIYSIGTFFIFREKIFFQITTPMINICNFFYFYIIVLLADQIFLKISKYSKFISFLKVNLFLLVLSTLTEYFLKANNILKNTFLITFAIKILILKDLWMDWHSNIELKNNFFINSMIYRKIRINITIGLLLDLIPKIFFFFSHLENFQYFIASSQLVNYPSLFVFSDKILYISEISNSFYSILIFSIINCTSIFLYYVAFDKKKNSEEHNANSTKNFHLMEKKYVILNEKNQYEAPLSTFLHLERKNKNFLFFNELLTSQKSSKNLDEKKRWIIKKNGINMPFSIILHGNEFQVTKQLIWYDIKNKKN